MTQFTNTTEAPTGRCPICDWSPVGTPSMFFLGLSLPSEGVVRELKGDGLSCNCFSPAEGMDEDAGEVENLDDSFEDI
jgi:hypothetical protein